MPRDSAAADRPASYLVGTASAFPLFFRDRTKPINQLPFSPSAKFPKSGSSCESRVKTVESELSQKSRQLQRITPILIFFSWAWAEKPIVSAATAANNPAARRCPASHPPE